MEYWIDKTILITDCTSEISFHIIKKLSKIGLKVIGFIKNEDIERNIREKLKKSGIHDNRVIFIKHDLSKLEKIEEVFKEIGKFGNVVSLINVMNNETDVLVTEGEMEKLKDVIDTNISGLVSCIRFTTEPMIRNNQRGHIITIDDRRQVTDNNFIQITNRAIDSVHEILRHEFRFLEANIKITFIEVKEDTNHFKDKIQEKSNAEDIADFVINILDTPKHLQIHKILLDVGQD